MTNFPATLAAVTARGPRCDDCGTWTYRPDYLTLPQAVSRLCPQCLPVSAKHRRDVPLGLTLSMVLRADLTTRPEGFQ